MNGAEHYEQAEALLKVATNATGGSNDERWALASAQVHATLALTAVTHAPIVRGTGWTSEQLLWCHVLYGDDFARDKTPDGER